ncbi:MAG: TRAP transporter substrate-binding protein [Negativicutes bacterium]|nr:TRAP transporter substrate-binding protein [Negativicutes bacterium]
MTKNKLALYALVLLFLFSALSAGCGSSQPAAEQKPVVLKAYDSQPPDYPTALMLKEMGRLLDERTKGRIKVEVIAGGQLGGEKEATEMMQSGAIGFGHVNASPLTGFVPKMGVLSLPYLFRDIEHLYKVVDGPIGQEMFKELEKNNLVGLVYLDAGARSFYTKSRAINTPDDAKGQKIRVQQNKIFVDTVSALGASATPMGYGEVYSGLQSGMIDGAENNPPSLLAVKHYEVCKFFALDEHSMVPEIIIMSKKVFESLSPDDQKLVRQAAVDAAVFYKKIWNESIEKAYKDLAAQGVTISKPDKEPFRKAVAPVYEKYPEYKELISQIQAVK